LNSFSISELITALVALYGAILSTIAFIRQNRDRKPRVKVTMSLGLVFHQLQGSSGTQLIVEAANSGQVNITIGSWSIRYPGKKKLFDQLALVSPQLPAELSPGQKVTICMEYARLRNSLLKHGYSRKVKVRGEVVDGLGNRYLSKPTVVNLTDSN
jgi:hypothetical protein